MLRCRPVEKRGTDVKIYRNNRHNVKILYVLQNKTTYVFFYLLLSGIYLSTEFVLLDISCRGVCLVSNITELHGENMTVMSVSRPRWSTDIADMASLLQELFSFHRKCMACCMTSDMTLDWIVNKDSIDKSLHCTSLCKSACMSMWKNSATHQNKTNE